ncbi:uncharacterized protein [Anabrus simplex]|uniref:uncharacterized protein n=1 Tax=Anabrus simplex TaxID=316456 RepID=UPI0035A33B5E
MIGSVLLLTATLLVAVETNVLIQVDISRPKYITNNGKTEFVDSTAEVQCSPPNLCRSELKGRRFVLNTLPAVMQGLIKMANNCNAEIARIESPASIQSPSSTTVSPWKIFKEGIKASRKNRRKERRWKTSSSTTTTLPTTTMTTTTRSSTITKTTPTTTTSPTTTSTTSTTEVPWTETTTTEMFETTSIVPDEEISDTYGTTEKETTPDLEGEDNIESTTGNISAEIELLPNFTSTSRPGIFWGWG